MDQTQIDIKDLEIGYVHKGISRTVLKGLNLSFKSGQLIGLVGNNGIGKSTFLRTLSGLQLKLAGEIKVNNMPFENIGKNEMAKLLSIVLTEKVGGFNLTVSDLVSMGRVPYTNSFHELQKGDNEVIAECINLCGLIEHQNTTLAELSDGLFQKAMIAKGLAQEANIMLLDEPSAYLDFNSKHELFELLNDLVNKKSKCILASSHDLELILKYSTHLLVFGTANEYELIETVSCRKSVLFNKVTNNYFK